MRTKRRDLIGCAAALAALAGGCSVYDGSLLVEEAPDARPPADGGDARAEGGHEAGADGGKGGAKPDGGGGSGVDAGGDARWDGSDEDASGGGGAGGDAGSEGPACGNGIIEAGEECEPPGTGTCDAECKSQCDMSGKWALKVSLPVTWPKNSFVKAGSGTLIQWSLIDRGMSGRTGSESIEVCQLVLPDLVDFVGNKYRFLLPSPIAPSASTRVAATATFDGLLAGGGYTTEPAAFVLGAILADTVADPWPGNGALASNASSSTVPYATDDDGDGNLGITATMKTDDGYSLPLLANFEVADKIYFSIRLIEALSGGLDSCAQVSGGASLTKADLAVVGCHVNKKGACSASDRDGVQSYSPSYVGANGASFMMQKLPASATCAQALAKIP